MPSLSDWRWQDLAKLLLTWLPKPYAWVNSLKFLGHCVSEDLHLVANSRSNYRIRMISPWHPQEPSLPCSFPTQGYLMVQMAAGAPDFISTFQEGRRGKKNCHLSPLRRYFWKSWQPFLQYIGQDLVTQLHLTVRETGKYLGVLSTQLK